MNKTQDGQPERRSGPAQILIIDDDKMVARSLARMLKEHQTTVVYDGMAALALLAKDSAFDVVFCDLMMPGLSGAKVFERMQAEFPHLCERVVFVTGGVFSESIQHFLSTCGAPCLNKPFSKAALLQAIDNVRSSAKE